MRARFVWIWVLAVVTSVALIAFGAFRVLQEESRLDEGTVHSVREAADSGVVEGRFCEIARNDRCG